MRPLFAFNPAMPFSCAGGRKPSIPIAPLLTCLAKAIRRGGFPFAGRLAVQLLEDTSREGVMELIRLPQLIDLVIARGSEEMILHIMKNATVPVLGHGKGVCHVYVDAKADLAMAEAIAFNAKWRSAPGRLQRHGDAARPCSRKLPLQWLSYRASAARIPRQGRCGNPRRTMKRDRYIIPDAAAATEEDWHTEYLDLIVSIRVVKDVTVEAMQPYQPLWLRPYRRHRHAADAAAAEQFLKSVDSAAVLQQRLDALARRRRLRPRRGNRHLHPQAARPGNHGRPRAHQHQIHRT